MIGNHFIFNENQAFQKLKNVDLSAFPIHIMLALYSHSETLVKICAILDTSSDYLLGISDKLTYKMGGLTDEQMEGVLQFISLIEQANEVLDKQ